MMNTKMNIRVVILSAILLIVPASAYGQIAELNMIELNNYNDDGDILKCEDVALTDYAGLCLSNSGYALPLCSVMEDLGKNVGC
jgi:hypothetical protein